MPKLDKKKTLLFISWFFLVFLAYSLTLSSNMGYDSDYLQMPLEIEGRTLFQSRAFAHIIWIPLGKLIYNLAYFMGYTGGATMPVEIFNIFLASLGSALFLILIYELTGSILVSLSLSVLLSFSYGWWIEFVHTKLYSGGFLFVILSFYLYTKKDLKFKPFIIAAVNSMAVLFHITNLGILICSLLYFTLGTEKPKEKIINIFTYLSAFALIVFGSYYLISAIVFINLNLVSGYETSWLNFFKYHYRIFWGNTFEKIIFNPQTLMTVAYLALLLFLPAVSFKSILKDRLFYLSLIFGILLTTGLKMSDPMISNFACILIPFNIIIALSLKDYAKFNLIKKSALGLILIVLAGSLFTGNFTYFYSSKDATADFFYSSVIAKTNTVITPGDIIFANGSLPYYLEYYTKCKVKYLLKKYDNPEEYNELASEIRSHLDNKERVKIFLDTIVNWESTLIKSQFGMNFDYLMKNLSKDFNLIPLFQFDDKEAGLRKIFLYEIREK